MTYSQKLRDPRWQKKRLQILERDQWKCCACGCADKTLQVHHLVYAKKDPWDYDDECLQTLCEDCHEVRQELTDRASNALKMAVAKMSTEQISNAAQYLCDDALRRSQPDSFLDRRILRWAIDQMLDVYESGKGYMPERLAYDLIFVLTHIEIFCWDENFETRELKFKRMREYIAKLEETHHDKFCAGL
jgi:hypothetical protein